MGKLPNLPGYKAQPKTQADPNISETMEPIQKSSRTSLVREVDGPSGKMVSSWVGGGVCEPGKETMTSAKPEVMVSTFYILLLVYITRGKAAWGQCRPEAALSPVSCVLRLGPECARPVPSPC